ncbi:MAG: GSCFA domain-containing protein [Rhodobacterales bacterium]|nr:GSCFA domain-containing protein [Rhodobacterales bacterium]
MTARSPYQNLPPQAFWRSAIVEQSEAALDHLFVPKFALTHETALMTAGSCFAQHMHRALSGAGWNVLQAEPMTDIVPRKLAEKYSYGIYSARYGNLYTARQFRQLIQEALGDTPLNLLVWQRDGRYFDALRPSVEPDGYDTAHDVKRARMEHITAVRALLQQAECIIFTLGLTECWEDAATGLALPTAPGTIAGDYDETSVIFRNFTYPEVLADLEIARDTLRAHGLSTKIMLTVSPVPLTATATGTHIGTATTYSKSVLRAVCGHLVQTDADFDYFPSYEIITTPVVGGPFFAPNLRQPSPTGVDVVIGLFAAAFMDDAPAAFPQENNEVGDEDDVQCEEILLEAFRQ